MRCWFAVMTGIQFINIAWCCTDSFSEHPTLGLICIVGDISHYTVSPAEWLVYTSWRLLCIFLMLSRFTLGFAFVASSDTACLLWCGTLSAFVVRRCFPLLQTSSSGNFACAWKKLAWLWVGIDKLKNNEIKSKSSSQQRFHIIVRSIDVPLSRWVENSLYKCNCRRRCCTSSCVRRSQDFHLILAEGL